MPETSEAIAAHIAKQQNPDLQVETYRISDLIAEYEAAKMTIPSASVIQSLLANPDPNLLLLREFRNKLELRLYADKPGIVPWIRKTLGGSPVYALLVGVIFAILVTVAIYAIVFTVSSYVLSSTPSEPHVQVRWTDLGILCFSATMGACISLISRVEYFAQLYIFDPFLIFVNSLVKPIIACGFAITLYCILHSGLITIAAVSDVIAKASTPPTAQYAGLLWLLGFLSGFGERLAKDLITRADSLAGGTTTDK